MIEYLDKHPDKVFEKSNKDIDFYVTASMSGTAVITPLLPSNFLDSGGIILPIQNYPPQELKKTVPSFLVKGDYNHIIFNAGEKSSGKIIRDENKTKTKESFLSELFWKLIVPVIVIVAAAYLIFIFGIKKP